LPFFGPAVWWQRIPRVLPTSPRPLISHPSTGATFRPAPSSASGSHASEYTMSGDASSRGRQLVIRRGDDLANTADVAAVQLWVYSHVRGHRGECRQRL